jgi:hypothetical protein
LTSSQPRKEADDDHHRPQGKPVNVTVLGEFTLADYKEFEEVINFKVKFEGPVDLLFDLRE